MTESAAGSRALKAGAAIFGLLMLAVPAFSSPAQVLALTGVGGLLVGASLVTRFGRWAPAGTLAAVISVIQCAVWPPGTAFLAVEGLFALGYLILLDGPARAGPRMTLRWLRGQARFGIAGLVGTGVVLAALAVPSAASAWLVLAGLGAAVAAYLIALPLALPRRPPRSPGP